MKYLSRGRFSAALLVLVFISHAIAANVDSDLRRAAILQRGGDTPAALTLWKTWAERGDVDPAYNLAVVHQHGDGVPQDFAQALHWYRVAAERGDHASQIQIGSMYQRGEGVAVDEHEAHRWITRHRREHTHHTHSEQKETWRRKAATLVWESDMRDAVARSGGDGNDVVANLKRRVETSAAEGGPVTPRATANDGRVLAQKAATP